MAIEPLHVVDTNALIWHLSDDRKLGKQARAIFAAAERGETRLVVSAPVVAELYYADKKFGLFADFDAVFQRLRLAPHFRFASFEAEHVLGFNQDRLVPEMHDRIIAGLARLLGTPLIASDPKIIEAGVVAVIW
jgi:predicted nucleic acid-binding protein